MAMVRKQLYLADEQQRKVRRMAKRRGCTEAQVVREAIDHLPELVNSLDDLVVARLVSAGLLAPPPDDDDSLTEAEAEQIERDIEEWAELHGPIGLSEAVLQERRER